MIEMLSFMVVNESFKVGGWEANSTHKRRIDQCVKMLKMAINVSFIIN